MYKFGKVISYNHASLYLCDKLQILLFQRLNIQLILFEKSRRDNLQYEREPGRFIKSVKSLMTIDDTVYHLYVKPTSILNLITSISFPAGRLACHCRYCAKLFKSLQ